MSTKGDDFVKLFYESGMKEIVTNKKLNRSDVSVILYLGMNVLYGVPIVKTHPDKMQHDLCISKQSVYRCINKLERLKMIEFLENEPGDKWTIKINLNCFFRGVGQSSAGNLKRVK